MKFTPKRVLKSFLFLMLLIILSEVSGYLGILLLSRAYRYSPVVDLSTDYVSAENPYLRLRKILMGAPGYTSRFFPCYNLNYGLMPGYSLDGIQIHNEDGYKGPKINCIKGKKYRILFMGGYPTYGMLKDPDKCFPAQTGKILNEYFKKDSVEVINCGMAEGTSSEDLNLYLHKFRYYKPDMIVIQSGATDAHFDLSSDDYTPDYSNFRNYQLMEIERILPKSLFHSYFISFLAIAAYYHPRDVDMERVSTVLHVPQGPRWFTADMRARIKSGDLSMHPYYNNLNTLVSEALSDSATVILMPVVTDPNWKYYHGDFKSNKDIINKIIATVASKYNIPEVALRYESINPAYWHDYSNLYPEGEKQKAQIVANKIMEVLRSPK